MSKLSLSRAWDETRQVLARDGRLLATVALALFVLPGVIAQVVQPNVPQGELPPLGYWSAFSVIALLISLIGQLAMIQLATGRGHTVGDTIRDATLRTPAYVAASLMWIAPPAIALGILLGVIAQDPANPQPVALLAFLLVACAMLFVAIRMLFTSAVAASEAAGPISILKRSWHLTGGNWWRLFGFFLLFIITAGILTLVVQAVFGSVLAIGFGALDPLTVGRLILAAVNQLVGAAITTVFIVMLARLYLQSSGTAEAEMEEVFR